MRYRKLDVNGDYSFGHGQANFYIDEPLAVGQAVKTRLGLATGEWFLDTTEGTPYDPQILGAHTQATRDQAVRKRILDTDGVLSMPSYSSSVNTTNRKFSVSVPGLVTEFGQTSVATTL